MSLQVAEQREERKEERQKRLEERRDKERERQKDLSESVIVGFDEEEDQLPNLTDSDSEDSDIADMEKEGKSKRKKRRRRMTKKDRGGGGGDSGGESEDEDGVRALIPFEILKKTTATAVRLGLSVGQHTTMTAAFLTACEVDLDEFPISRSTALRRKKEVLGEEFEKSREEFKERLRENNYPLIVHVDTKLLSDTIGPQGSRVTNKSERLAIVVTSPMYKGEQFVCAPGLENATGRAQAQGAIDGLEEFGIINNVVGVNYDTTASNSSTAVGTVARIENHLDRGVLKVPCRHHIYELLGKISSTQIFGATTGPDNPLFCRLNREWPELHDKIDYNNLVEFDIGQWQGTFVVDVVNNVKLWAIEAYNCEVFPRDSYGELLLLIIKFLDPTAAINFKIRKPMDVTNARFMEKATYFIKLQLLAQQLEWLTAEDKRKIGDMAFISAVFYGPSFLQSNQGSRAVGLDLSSIHHFRQLRSYMPGVAEAVLNLWNRHLDYLTPEHVVTALVDDEWNDTPREEMARALLRLIPNRVNPLPPRPVIYPGPGFATNDNFWPQDGLPDIAQFIQVFDSFILAPDTDLKNLI